tara:strand:+ start:575 stop:745 length:171 start_codon:yes stop_codon:yes gene_type:complete
VTTSENNFIQKLLAIESEGLPTKKRAQIFQAFKDGKVNFNNLQACLDRIKAIRDEW